MPANVVKTERDEELWEKAKQAAEEQGRTEDYPYIMGIYKKMKGISKSLLSNGIYLFNDRIYLHLVKA